MLQKASFFFGDLGAKDDAAFRIPSVEPASLLNIIFSIYFY